MCGFCSGKKNKQGEDEKLVSCAECLRSGTCLSLSLFRVMCGIYARYVSDVRDIMNETRRVASQLRNNPASIITLY